MSSNIKNELKLLTATIEQLRSENGCPWDRRQTASSLIPYLREEVEELINAVEHNDYSNMCEELGDLLYLVMMIAEINREKGHFDFMTVAKSINEKLIRRHPHVFAGKPYKNEADLKKQWEKIKAEEKEKSIDTNPS
ncbi:MazG nucleotide pyrophosphohydrolase domain-containing protein [Desulfomarina sp.]